MARPIIIGAAAAIAAAVATAAGAKAADEAWALDGFQAPESVAFDRAREVLYVSNVAGGPDEKNGAGFISRVSPDGEMLELEWVTGLNAPKGLALDGDTLYVTDIDRLVAIDVEAGEIASEWAGEGAQFLNDPAVDDQGGCSSRIWRPVPYICWMAATSRRGCRMRRCSIPTGSRWMAIA